MKPIIQIFLVFFTSLLVLQCQNKSGSKSLSAIDSTFTPQVEKGIYVKLYIDDSTKKLRSDWLNYVKVTGLFPDPSDSTKKRLKLMTIEEWQAPVFYKDGRPKLDSAGRGFGRVLNTRLILPINSNIEELLKMNMDSLYLVLLTKDTVSLPLKNNNHE